MGSFPFSLSTNCPASSGILKTLCQGKTGFQQTLRNSDVSRFDSGGEGGALLLLKGLLKFCPFMRSFLARRPPRQTLEKSQFLIDSFCRCVIDWASCGEGRRERGVVKSLEKGALPIADRKCGFGSAHFPLSTCHCHHLIGCAALSIVACTANLLPRVYLVVLHWHGGHIHQHESRCNLFSNSAARSLAAPSPSPCWRSEICRCHGGRGT